MEKAWLLPTLWQKHWEAAMRFPCTLSVACLVCLHRVPTMTELGDSGHQVSIVS